MSAAWSDVRSAVVSPTSHVGTQVARRDPDPGERLPRATARMRLGGADERASATVCSGADRSGCASGATNGGASRCICRAWRCSSAGHANAPHRRDRNRRCIRDRQRARSSLALPETALISSETRVAVRTRILRALTQGAPFALSLANKPNGASCRSFFTLCFFEPLETIPKRGMRP